MKTAMIVLGVLCFAASAGMYVVGSNSGHMTELKDLFWVPLPLGVVLLLAGALKKGRPGKGA